MKARAWSGLDGRVADGSRSKKQEGEKRLEGSWSVEGRTETKEGSEADGFEKGLKLEARHEAFTFA
jgi:hypothetical protein